MKVNSISNNQNFQGNFIVKGKLTGEQVKNLKWVILRGEDSLRDKPYDIFIKSSNNGNLVFSSSPNFSESCISRKHACPEEYLSCIGMISKDADEAIKNDKSIFNQILYVFGLKKYKGHDYSTKI